MQKILVSNVLFERTYFILHPIKNRLHQINPPISPAWCSPPTCPFYGNHLYVYIAYAWFMPLSNYTAYFLKYENLNCMHFFCFGLTIIYHEFAHIRILGFVIQTFEYGQFQSSGTWHFYDKIIKNKMKKSKF